MSSNNCEYCNEKLSAYIDLELTQQEMQKISLHLETCSECQTTYDELVSLKQKIGELKAPRIEEEEIMQILNESTSNTLQTLGWLALIFGGAGLLIMHWIHFWQDDSISITMKVLWTLFEAGGVLLLAGVLRQRLIARKTDRYKDVQL